MTTEAEPNKRKVTKDSYVWRCLSISKVWCAAPVPRQNESIPAIKLHVPEYSADAIDVKVLLNNSAPLA